ncbi:MAG: hypothetical protein Q4C78_02565 [Synergistaceae bacterium]|nr:hypothetical protein [Synergistaceae bacterium]
MVSLEKVYANYLSRKYVVVSSSSLNDALAKFWTLNVHFIFTCDNFIDLSKLDNIGQSLQALYYKPKYGFLGKIEIIKEFCQRHSIIFIEDFTENFSANKIIDGKSLYAGMFGDVSVCIIDNVFFYATDNEKLAEFLGNFAVQPEVSKKKKLIDFLFEVEVEKRKRRIVVANYVMLIAYTGLFRYLKPIDEVDGEAASYPVFAVTPENACNLWHYMTKNGAKINKCNDFLLLPTDVAEAELKNIIDLISKFYKEVC